jgi:hypothetical protein
MSHEEKKPYTHKSQVTGRAEGDDPAMEHREKVSHDGTPPNELRPRDPAGEDGYGPRTTEQPRTTTRDGA